MLDQLGSFSRAGVLWLGASTIPAAVRDFQQSLVEALLEAGIGHDRKAWKFHLTLYRKMRKPPPIMDPVAIEWPLDGFEPDRVRQRQKWCGIPLDRALESAVQ